MSLLDDTKIDKITKEYLEGLGFSIITSMKTSIAYGLSYADLGKQYYIYLVFNKNGSLEVSLCYINYEYYEMNILYEQVLKSPDKYDLDLVLSDIDSNYNYKSKLKSSGYLFGTI